MKSFRFFDEIEIDKLDRRDWHLWLLAISMIVILGTGVAVLMYPSVFGAPAGSSDQTFQRVFVGFCVLNFLFVVYVLDRQMAIRRLRRSLIVEQRRNAELRAKASSDLIRSLPNFAHFQDRLAMQFRRAVNSDEPLSMLVVGLKPSTTPANTVDLETAHGDAVKAILRKLRAEDSIYHFGPGVFGILLPGLTPACASLVSARLAESLTDVAGAVSRFSFEIEAVSYPQHVGAAYEMEDLARNRFARGESEPSVV